jgi:hypothetical protein
MNSNKKSKKLKILAWYELIISSFIAFSFVYLFFSLLFLPFGFFVSLVGIAGGILLIKNSRIGFYLSLIWAFSQIFIIQIGELIINLTQGIFLTLAFIGVGEFETFPDVFFTPNLVGILLLILFTVWRKDILGNKRK